MVNACPVHAIDLPGCPHVNPAWSTTDRIARERHLHAMVALDTFDHIAERVRNLLSHGRRITVTDRFTYVDSPPEVTAGLTVDRIEPWASDRGKGLRVLLKPGLLAGFGIAAYAGKNDTEKQEWKRFHAGKSVSDRWDERRRDMTEVTITGGLTGDGPARDDQLVIRDYNRDGVCDEKVIVFDAGPRDAEERAARWLYGMTLGPTHREDREREWDYGKVSDSDTALWQQRAADLLAAVADERT